MFLTTSNTVPERPSRPMRRCISWWGTEPNGVAQVQPGEEDVFLAASGVCHDGAQQEVMFRTPIKRKEALLCIGEGRSVDGPRCDPPRNDGRIQLIDCKLQADWPPVAYGGHIAPLEGDGGVFPWAGDPGVDSADVVGGGPDQPQGVHPPPVGVGDAICAWSGALGPLKLSDHLLLGDRGLEDITLVSCLRHSSVAWVSAWKQPGGRWAQWGRCSEGGGEMGDQLLFCDGTVGPGGVVQELAHADARVGPVQFLQASRLGCSSRSTRGPVIGWALVLFVWLLRGVILGSCVRGWGACPSCLLLSSPLALCSL